MRELLNRVLFQIGDRIFVLADLISVIIVLIVALSIYRLVNKVLLPRYFEREKVITKNRQRVRRIILSIIGLLAMLAIIWLIKINYTLLEGNDWSLTINLIVEAVLILQVARLLDWIISKALVYNYQKTKEAKEEDLPPALIPEKDEETRASKTVQYAVYAFAAILLLQNFRGLDFQIFQLEDFSFRLSNIVWVIFIILFAQLLAWILTQLILFRYYRNRKIEVGSRYAINQLLKYVIYIFAVVIALDSLGVKMTVIWGGAAALLVGVGLGMQQIFNDLISGIIMLFEGRVAVGNVVDVNGLVGTVKQIGLRTSVVETRDHISVIVPNSKLSSDNVVNWSHEDNKARFSITVGVAYGSDTEMVKKLLMEVSRNNVYVLSFPAPLVRMTAFGDSSLDFELLFWSRNFLVIEDIKSDLRLEIDKTFRAKEIQIPFPQRDVWMKK